jgi:hypothetical protein
LENSASLIDIQIFDDIRQVSGMKLSKAALGDLQTQQVRGSKRLDEFPGNKLVRQGLIE